MEMLGNVNTVDLKVTWQIEKPYLGIKHVSFFGNGESAVSETALSVPLLVTSKAHTIYSMSAFVYCTSV